MGRVSLSSKQSEAGQEAQTHRVEELRAKLQAADVREKSALAKIALLGRWAPSLLLMSGGLLRNE